jgi:hypothetical protein
VQQQMDNTQPRAVAKALVDADKIHGEQYIRVNKCVWQVPDRQFPCR